MTVYLQEAPARAEVNAPVGAAQEPLSLTLDLVRRLLPDFDQVSVTVIDDAGSLVTCAQAGDVVADLDRLQYGLSEGPCIDSLRDADPVVAPHIEGDERWGRYLSSATGLGLRSQVATPLLWREGNLLGALNLYSTTHAEVAHTAPAIAKALAAQIAGALASSQQIEHLHRALVTRRTIGIAMGMLMAQYQLTETAAFAVLRRRSSYSNVKLRDIAEEMVAQRSATGIELPPPADC